MSLYAVAGVIFLTAEIAYVSAVILDVRESDEVYGLATFALGVTVALIALALLLQIVARPRGEEERESDPD